MVDGRWVVIAAGGYRGKLKACEFEMGIVQTFGGRSRITSLDIFADSELLVSGSKDFTVRIYMELGNWQTPSRIQDRRLGGCSSILNKFEKLAVKSWVGKCLEVWDKNRMRG